MIGIFIAPTNPIMARILSLFGLCFCVSDMIKYVIYVTKRQNVDVIRASQTQYVFHVDFPQIIPVNKAIKQNNVPNFAACDDEIKMIGFFHTKVAILQNAINEYPSRDIQQNGTCRYMSLMS